MESVCVLRAVAELLPWFLCVQGDEDKIVPPNQAERMYAALKAKHIPCALKIYAGEQHGFRKAENIQVRSCILYGLLSLSPSVKQRPP